MSTIKINAQLAWQINRTAQGAVLAICEPLGLVLEAADEAEAHSLIGEGLHYFFLDHLEEGTLERFLSSKGWALGSPLPQHMTPGNDPVRFDVPWSVEGARAS